MHIIMLLIRLSIYISLNILCVIRNADVFAASMQSDENVPLQDLQNIKQQIPTNIQFGELFKIEKDSSDPSRLLNVILPPFTTHHFLLFVAKVTDISTTIDAQIRDANRTFLAPSSDSTMIIIHGLNPGHQYSIEILGRKGHDTTLIKEESIIMDPKTLNLSNAEIQSHTHTITILCNKEGNALQEMFRVEYIQRSPLKRYPILDVHDIPKRHNVEIFLSNLSPGRDYDLQISSLTHELRSKPWKGVITTKPMSPINLTAFSQTNNINETCVRLKWMMQAESGYDSFKIIYGLLHLQNITEKAETSQNEIELCKSISAGHPHIFAVAAVKSSQVSIPNTISYIVRPLAILQISVKADFSRNAYHIYATLPPLSISYANKCQIIVISEKADRLEQDVRVQTSATSEPFCEIWMNLVPGRRYEVSVAALSDNSSSTKTFLNKALEPGFNFNAFGLFIKENEDGESLNIEWPRSEMTMLRIANLWPKIVGNESRLHLSISPLHQTIDEENDETQQIEIALSDAPLPLKVHKLHIGGCYRVVLYTVTSSGIVSEERYDSNIRLRPPRIKLILGAITSHSATINVILLKNTITNDISSEIALPAKSNDEMTLLRRISIDCVLEIIVVDSNSSNIYARSLLLTDNQSQIMLNNLQPYLRYNLNAQVICGLPVNSSLKKNLECEQVKEILDVTLFETQQDRPGPVRNLTVIALGPHTAQISWKVPEKQNGLITHYIINVIPLGLANEINSSISPQLSTNANLLSNANSQNSISQYVENYSKHHLLENNSPYSDAKDLSLEKQWSIRVPMAIKNIEFLSNDSESILPQINDNDGTLIVILEKQPTSLFGGSRYRISVAGVTAAGVGDLPTSDKLPILVTPITAPPQLTAADGFQLNILPNSIRSDRVSITFNTLAFSDKNGLITKLAFIVSQLDANDNENPIIIKKQIGDANWAEVQSYSISPPYTAIEFNFADLGGYLNLRPQQITQEIGVEENCAQRDGICNGPLRPNMRYRIRLRLFTSSNLWTDSVASDIIQTEAIHNELHVGILLTTFAFICFSCAFIISLIISIVRHRSQTKESRDTERRSVGINVLDCSGCCQLSSRNYDDNDARQCYIINDNNSNIQKSGGYDFHDRIHQLNHHHQKILFYQHKVQLKQKNDRVDALKKQRTFSDEQKREINWIRQLKMIMAERVADCLAKLGIESSSDCSQERQNSPAHLTTNSIASSTINVLSSTSPYSLSINDANEENNMSIKNSSDEIGWLNSAGRSHTMANGQIFTATSGNISPNNVKTVTSTLSAPKHQLEPLESNTDVLNGPFNAHHRRSKSLRERTGVDQRLERLPSGPPPNKILLWTVVRTPNNNSNSINDKSRPVRICDFHDHIRLMSADSDLRFSEEYEELRHVGVGQSSIAAELTINRGKNRFTNILPYDHSRVKLLPTNNDEDNDTDYVNASYIPGFNSRKEFIAAQGPLPLTRDHFWRMVWEQQCPAIVALTKCIEKGRDKCHQYWPNDAGCSILYGNIEVTLLNDSIDYGEYAFRELRLKNIANSNQPARTIIHLHYKTWPDFGVPDHPAGIVEFSRLFRNKLPPNSTDKPTIVHCSAGVGRSGTFIALDRLIQNIEYGRDIDIFGTICEMRLERCHMVQNELQYIFIHHCIQYLLENFFSHLQRTPRSTPTPDINNRNIFFGDNPSQHSTDMMCLNQLRSFVPSSIVPKIEIHHNPAFAAGDEDEEGLGDGVSS